MTKKVIFCICLGLLALEARAQDFSRLYRNAKEFYEEGSYSLAMEAFKSLVVYDASNPYSEYASFYYGLAAFHQGYPQVAKDMFLQMKRLYPAWSQLDEVNFWLAKVHFEQREYFQALLNLNEVDNPAMLESKEKLKRLYLKDIKDVETLNMMMEEHPTDSEVARALVKAMASLPYSLQDEDAIDSLINKFGFLREELIVEQTPETIFKDRYKVALLFPFLTSALDPTPVPKVNQAILDLYRGMQLAKDTLAKQGIFLDLLAYDTDLKMETLNRLLRSEELKTVDLIVGPIGPAGPTLTLMTDSVRVFSERNKINMINPISNGKEYLGENPFAFLYQPSPETIASKTAGFISEYANNKNCVVIFGNSPRDSAAASSFVRSAEELGMNIILVKGFTPETSSGIVDTLAHPTEFDDAKKPLQFTLPRDSIGGIFVASDDPLLFTKVMSSAEIRGDSILIVGSERWLDESVIDFGNLERLRVVLASPNFIPSQDVDYILFRKKYFRAHGALPPSYATQGFEFTLFVGDLLKNYGVYYQSVLDDVVEIPGHLVPGYNFQNAHDNQVVPFVAFKNGQLVRVDK